MRWGAERGMMLRTIISMMGGGLVLGPKTLAYSTVVTSRGGSLTPNELLYLTTFETSLGSDLDEFDRLYIHGLNDSIAARTSFVNPSTTAITPVNNPTFSPSEGYQSNGSTSYLDHNVAESALVKYTQNSNSFFLYSLSNISEIANEYGVFNGASIITSCIINSSTISYLGNNTSIGSINFTSNTNSLGLFGCLRVNNSMTNYKNSVSYNSYTSSPQALSNLNFYSLCRNENGSPVIFSTKKHALIGYGSSNINQSNFYNAVQALGTSIGWAV